MKYYCKRKHKGSKITPELCAGTDGIKKLSNILSFTGKLRPRENQLVFRLEETIDSRKKNLSIPLTDFSLVDAEL